MALWSAKTTLNSKLNICLVGSRFPVLGRAARESFLLPLARSLAKKGHKVTILSWQNPQHRDYFEAENIRAFYLGHSQRANRKDFPQLVEKKFIELHSAERFDIVHGLDSSALLIAKKKRIYKIRITFDVSATHMSEIFAILAMSKDSVGNLIQTGIAILYKYMTTFWSKDRPLLKTADAVFVTTPLQKIALERYYLFPETKTFLVPYGSEVVHLIAPEKPEDLRLKLSLPAQSRVIMTVSDMNELEEVTSLLRAFAKTVVKRPSCRLIIVGNGPLFKAIEFEMLNLALGNKVIMTGALSTEDLQKHLALSDIYVNLSARTTGFEPSMLEAMAFKKVVIGSELSPMANIIENQVDGYLVRPAAIQELHQLMSQLVSEEGPSPDMGERARKKVLELFDTDKMTERLLNAFNQTLGSRQSSSQT
jgi:1,2-diacylglycerol 3-alpha-glucosyltransferase